MITDNQFTISNLQLSDAGYFIFLRSNQQLDFELVKSGSFVELWPENQRLITYWKTSAFDEEEALCKGIEININQFTAGPVSSVG